MLKPASPHRLLQETGVLWEGHLPRSQKASLGFKSQVFLSERSQKEFCTCMYVVCMHAYICVHMCVSTHVCAHVCRGWRLIPAVFLQSSPYLLMQVLQMTSELANMGQSSQSVCPGVPHLHPIPALGLPGSPHAHLAFGSVLRTRILVLVLFSLRFYLFLSIEQGVPLQTRLALNLPVYSLPLKC